MSYPQSFSPYYEKIAEFEKDTIPKGTGIMFSVKIEDQIVNLYPWYLGHTEQQYIKQLFSQVKGTTNSDFDILRQMTEQSKLQYIECTTLSANSSLVSSEIKKLTQRFHYRYLYIRAVAVYFGAYPSLTPQI